MSGKAILVVGARGTGKTTTNKSMVSKVHPTRRLVLDVNGEYTDLYPFDFIGFETFSKKMTKVRGMFIVIEEATIFLDNRGKNGNVQDTLVMARHRDNTIVMSFHSFRTIPKYIYALCNMVILHKTGDTAEYIEDTFENPKLTEAFLEIQSAPNLKGENGKEYSPNKEVKLY